ncbi:VIR protein [Plasmodium vivax]|uniref:VIR protein n=1 Tax=Plasmodium vivax TaxID=5855 RepID=A0A1G4ED91_PLAVI|nr:VIR protein [Plasmodium vivax]
MDDINLDYLTSKKLYNQWSKEVKGTSYLSKCYYFPSAPTNVYENICELCRKLLRNLEVMQYIKNDEFYTCGSCKLLNYWLYDEVKKILSSHSENKYKEIITSLHAEWSKHKFYRPQLSGGFKIIEVKPQCKPDNTVPNLTDIEDKKRIHEHCLNYYIISKSSISDECQKYKDNIQSQSLKYEKFESLFPKDESNCTTYYNKCKSYNPKNIVTQSNCPQEIALPEASEEVAASPQQSSLEEGGGVDEGELGEEAVAGVGRLSGIKEGEVGDVGGDREEGKIKGDVLETSPAITTLRIGSTNQDLSSGVYGADTDGSNVQSINDSSDNVKSNGTIISASSVGTIGFLFLLYKFTPLRSVLDPRIRKTKSNLKNGVQGSNELQSQEYNFDPTDMDFNRYNIGYQSK